MTQGLRDQSIPVRVLGEDDAASLVDTVDDVIVTWADLLPAHTPHRVIVYLLPHPLGSLLPQDDLADAPFDVTAYEHVVLVAPPRQDAFVDGVDFDVTPTVMSPVYVHHQPVHTGTGADVATANCCGDLARGCDWCDDTCELAACLNCLNCHCEGGDASCNCDCDNCCNDCGDCGGCGDCGDIDCGDCNCDCGSCDCVIQ